jgi:orotidine-5'-phosphate decarboxylase
MANLIIKVPQSIIPACDVTELSRFEEIVRETQSISKIGAYKISAVLGLKYSIPKIVEIARKYTDKPLIYDHQKAGTDIPDTGKDFIRVLKESGINALIIFPLSGPVAQLAWINYANEFELPIIGGGYMTHKGFIASDGGYINDDAPEMMYTVSAKNGITNFVVPGNKPDIILNIKNILLNLGVTPTFYSPGFVSQGGKISEAAVAAGTNWHAIVGRAIYESTDLKSTVLNLISQF